MNQNSELENFNPANFFDRQETDEIDNLIAERQSRPGLIDNMRKKRDSKKAVKKANRSGTFDFENELKKYGWLYLFLAVSALFTMTLGFYMGLSPHLDSARGVVIYMTDLPHIFLACVYAIAFVTITEVAFGIFKWLYFTREEMNTAQQYSTIAGMILAATSIIGTGVAGGFVIASNISFMTNFVEVPEAAQRWVIVVIPVLLTFYAILGTIYSLSSESAAAERMTRESKRESQLEHDTRMTQIGLIGVEIMQKRILQQYMAAIDNGTMTLSQAQGHIAQGRSLAEAEQIDQKDYSGDGSIGESSLGDLSPAASFSGNGNGKNNRF